MNHNSKILSAFNRNLGDAIKSQKLSPLDYGSGFQYLPGIVELFSRHERENIILDIIQIGSQYHLSPIYEATRKFDLEAMLIRGNHRSSKSTLNAASLEKSMDKEVKHGWELPLTIYLVFHVKDAGFFPLEADKQFSIN